MSRFARSLPVILAVAGLLVTSVGLPPAAVAAGAPQMEARVLLEGHARLGSWLAIEVHLANEGPSVVGELRLQGGAQGGTRFSVPVDLPAPRSDKTYLLYAQPPSFGQQLEVLLNVGDQVVARQKVAFKIHDPGQLVVGVVAAQPQGILAGLVLPAAQGQNPLPPVVVPLEPDDLPERIEAWASLDRLIWQDVDTNTLSSRQLASLRGWLALGGRLVIAGGTAGPGVLSAIPDALLPYRPTTTVDVAPDSLVPLLGRPPAGASDVPALGGPLDHGRILASSGDSVVAAEAGYGSGAVTIVGIDPTTGWIAESQAATALWRGLIPARTASGLATTDDSQIVGAVSELPALALPPTGGLLILLLGYIVLVGPVNYLVLRRLDRREWAWVTMPILIAVFAAGAYGFGSALRGSDVIVNEVAIVRGAPDASEGTAQVYLGVFSPARGTYQVSVPGGALLSSPIVGDFFGGQGTLLDVVQGEPAKVRNLAVGFGSLRTVRAETATVVPRIHADLRLVDGTLQGTIRNDSDRVLEAPAIVLGGNARILDDLAPGATATVSLKLAATQLGQPLSDRIFGQIFGGGPVASNEKQRRNATRHRIVDQLTYDPMFGNLGQLPAEGPVILAWGRDGILDVDVEGQRPARTANVLYYVPVSMTVRGRTAFRADLVRSTVVAMDAMFFGKDPYSLSFGQGSVTVAYRPIAFDGRLEAERVVLAMGFGGEVGIGGGAGKPIEPIPGCPGPDPATDGCPEPVEPWDGIPEVEVLDLTDGAWHRLPHLGQGLTYELVNPARYVDPATGTIQFRFVNDRQDGIGMSFGVSIEGTVR